MSLQIGPTPSYTPAAAGAQTDKNAKDSPEKIRDAAHQFESLLIGQLMRQVREAASLEGGDQASAAIMEMAEQQFAQVLSAAGGLGLANLIVRGLDRESRLPGPNSQYVQAAGP